MIVSNSFKTGLKYAAITVAVGIGAILYHKNLKHDNSLNKVGVPYKKPFSLEELSVFDGVQQEKLYLAVVGNIYDVTVGIKHYMKGSPYHYFIGKDGTRALVTGNFKDESNNKDHILDLSCSDLTTILRWRQTYKQKYKYIGLLSGRYYDKNGEETQYMSEVKQKIKQCKKEKEEEKIQEKIYPACNMAWNKEDGTIVWCTKSSGGVVRDWVGVPRQLYIHSIDNTQCVCVNHDHIKYNSLLQEYEGCPNTSTQCSVIEN